jgi:hypothetical protein
MGSPKIARTIAIVVVVDLIAAALLPSLKLIEVPDPTLIRTVSGCQIWLLSDLVLARFHMDTLGHVRLGLREPCDK